MVRYLASELKRIYGAIVQRPMPWRIIDALASLEEADEKQKPDAARRETRKDRDGEDPGASSPSA